MLSYALIQILVKITTSISIKRFLKNIHIKYLRYNDNKSKTKVAKECFYGARKPIKILDVDVDNIVISKLIETKNNSRDFTGYLGEVVKLLLVLILPKLTGNVKTFKEKNNNLMSLRIYDEKLLESIKPAGLGLKT